MELIDKEVDFATYCPKCVYWETAEDDDPCHECLQNPSNQNSHIPINLKFAKPEENTRKRGHYGSK